MSDTVIKVCNVSKKYLLRHEQRERYIALRDVMASSAKRAGRRVYSLFTGASRPDALCPSREEFYALKDISFEVKRGERVGIIGRNGAGKTTLLKLLSRITEPTSGRIEITGRVASLLEVGTGFHPELTGRENVFLNGAILGMSKAEIQKKFEEIVDFAEIEKFLDTPVKRYSSGMYVRLAFAVAAHLEPEILVVDEVLAVGDAQFQQKCLGKMGNIAQEGRTILFVSHNMGAVQSLCERGMVILDGKVYFEGDTHAAISAYLVSGTESMYEWRKVTRKKLPMIRSAWFENCSGERTDHFNSGAPVCLIIETENHEGVSTEISVSFWDNLRRPLWNFTHAMHGIPALPENKQMKVRIAFYPPQLTIPELIVDLAIGPKAGGHYYDHIMNAMKCAVIERSEGVIGRRYPEWPIFCKAELTCEAIDF
jgi:lipopolysaccharide transport system ATP-binding protein